MQELENIDEFLKEEAVVMAEVITLKDGRQQLGKMYPLTNSKLVLYPSYISLGVDETYSTIIANMDHSNCLFWELKHFFCNPSFSRVHFKPNVKINVTC
jgi:hypothetical protein